MLALADRLSQYKTQGITTRAIASGKLVRVVGLTLEATGCKAPIGSLCKVEPYLVKWKRKWLAFRVITSI